MVWGTNIMVSASVCKAGSPGLSLAQSVCFRKVKFYLYVVSPSVVPTSAANWFTKGVLCVIVYVIMHVKDPYMLYVVRLGHYVLLAGFCPFLYSLHVLGRGIYMIQTNYMVYISHFSGSHLCCILEDKIKAFDHCIVRHSVA